MKSSIRIQRTRKRKNESPNGLPIKYAGRPGRFGNPFKVVALPGGFFGVRIDKKMGRNILGVLVANTKPVYKTKVEAQAAAVGCYKAYYMPDKPNDQLTEFLLHDRFIKDVKEHFAGHNISCWCKIGEPCHADLLVMIVNEF